VASAEAQLATATLTYQNSENLFKNKVIGNYELQTAKNTMETARAQVQQTKSAVASAQAALANARQNLNFCYVTAPTAGVVGNLPYKQGALVSPSSTPAVTTVSNISTVEVYFSMTEKDILAMTKNAGGMKAAVSAYPPVKLRLADGTDYRHTGTVTKVSGLIDPATGSVSMIARFPNPDHLLKSGGSGSIIVPKTANNSIIIPQSLTAQVQDKIFVYKVDGQNKVHYTEITVSPNNDGKSFIVTSGLKVGDKIVSAGITKLNDGMEIKPITEAQYQKKIKEAEKLGENQADAAKLKKALGM
jgi:membrane fusion protein (multidrug efflux system)